MKTQSILFGTVGFLLVAVAIGCGSNNAPNADRSADNTTAASQPAPPPAPDWTVDRDSYITRRQQDLDEIDHQWDTFKDKANRKSRRAWEDMKQETAGLRHDLDEAKNATKETWDSTRQKLDERWNRIENKKHDTFGDDKSGS